VIDVVSSALLLVGVALAVVAGIGLVRLPDVLSRMHAATKPATLGLLLVAVGAALQVDDGSSRAKLLLVAAFQFLTSPVAGHMIGRAAYRSGTPGVERLVVDELRSDGPPPERPPA
jgi:multicomponent Na+:H+ antiporter subunit G